MTAPVLDVILKERGLDNADLVKASTQQLTFKQIQKARSGHPVSANIQAKIVQALNTCVGGETHYLAKNLF